MKSLLLFLGLLSFSALQAADIVALCIGNNDYVREEDQLDTPINDAQLMKQTLERLPGGADVKLLTNASKEDIELALNALKVRAQGAKLALVFYSGHGMDGQPDGYATEDTFLLPVEATIPDVNYLHSRAVPVKTVLDALKAAPVTARAVILDCCRSGAPKATAALTGSTKNFGDLDERVKSALGKAVVPDATLIAFAAGPGRKAAAFLTEADENSPFTKFLTDQFTTGSGNLRDLVEAAAENTETATGRRQVPYVSYTGAASAIRQIVFRSSPAPTPPPGTPSPLARMTPPVLPPLPAPNLFKGHPPFSATKALPYVNELGMKFVPVMRYEVGKKVLFCIWETRRQDYAAYARSVSGVDRSWEAQEEKGVPCGHEDDHPVVGVNWTDAKAFCSWLTLRERAAGRIGAKDEYRLPSDQEWSYAVGIGTQETSDLTPRQKSGKQDVYPWGTGFPPPANNGNYADSAAKEKQTAVDKSIKDYHDGYATTSPVGKFASNTLGLHDLGGNVVEWCLDWHDAEQKLRVLRGGSWENAFYTILQSSWRYSFPPEFRGNSTGFRCVLVLSN
ncbi:caspase domain-containing protein [Prosthecobacter fusiformis]|uniref:Caspase domain-containing protein n=1 Tax=Prosthecobacter fusiformis TaxID=48464 RepID=A0A4R7RQZ9_9BACT|nr:SUMF1/EgtB/PvdO family nonheme iron enzyme [Prosthecobacter fusiformis]TDU67298.1 caspase domain-containing protein [Prosthecobacter fusiformis]